MSRIGKNPVPIPDKVEVKISDASVTVKGPKGELSVAYTQEVKLAQEDGNVVVTRVNDSRTARALHGTTRANIQNLMIGVSEGFKRTLNLVGVGFRAEVRGDKLLLNVGHSHPILFFAPKGITFETDGPTTIHISGIDKQLVGQVAAKIRSLRPPEPYKGKGVKYSDEYIKRKAGKTAKA